ncbi:unnamed protein product [Wickerhamomyces anomalus]
MNITIPHIPNFQFSLPTFKNTKSASYKLLRKQVTAKYGKITLISTLIIIALLPLLKSIQSWYLRRAASKRNSLTNKSHSFIHRLVFHSEVSKIILFWSVISFLLNYLETYDDLMFIAKRLGRVSCACLPSLLFLTLRPSPLPKTLYLSLLPIHKWLSRIVVLEGAIHTILYLIYFVRENTMFKIKKATNIWGIVAMIAFTLIAITSLPQVRRFSFNTFYITHYIMTWISVLAVHFHAKPGIGLYTILNISILIAQIGYRFYYSKKTKISVIPISPTLSLVEFPLSSIPKQSNLPGSHVRINNKNGILKDIYYKIIPLAHPYTVASLPNDPTVKLIIRRGNFPLRSNQDYYITGAFEPKLDFIREQSLFHKLFEPRRLLLTTSPLKYSIDAHRVMIVVGGSGISFGIPLLRILNYNGISARLMWVCKDIKDLNLLNHFRGVQGIECYITGDVDENDIVIDYYEDDKEHRNKVLPVQPPDYGSTIEEEDEIDFTTLGRSYKEAHRKGSSSGSTSSDSFKDHENVNIDISNTCGYNVNNPLSSTSVETNSSSQLHQLPHELISPDAFKNIKISKNVKIFYGRPNLGADHYDWCLQSQCVGPTMRQGHSVCCRDLGEHDVDKSKIWVVAAGPTGLVDHAKQWAIDGGLRYHIESFSV